MNIKSKKSNLRKNFVVSADKSISHRCLILGSLASESSSFQNVLWGEDVQATSQILNKLGCKQNISIDKATGTAHIILEPTDFRGTQPLDSIFDCGNSGTTMRLMTGLLGNCGFSFTLIGDQSLNSRPMKRVVEPLHQIGVDYYCEGANYRPPIICKGNLSNNNNNKISSDMIPFFEHHLQVASAQVKSALMLLGIQNNGCRITGGKKSRNHTEIMLEHMGANISYPHAREKIAQHIHSDEILLQNTRQLQGLHCIVPGDQSSAAFVIAATLICSNSKIILKNINMNKSRTKFLEHIIKMGANIEIEYIENKLYIEPVANLRIRYTEHLKNVDIKKEDIPRLIDEIPILTLIATQASGIFELSNASELRVKETDRIRATVVNLRVLGVSIEETDDGLILQGKQPIIGGVVDSYFDHRIAMTGVIAGMISKESVIVQNTKCIQTSFPNFFTEFKKCGADITIM
jgi:3-phosphoshikimate 1-carboxyvinyltransferase